jgi:hypothetical protein
MLSVLALCSFGQALQAMACLSCELESFNVSQPYSVDAIQPQDLAAACEGCCNGLTGGHCCVAGAALTSDFYYSPPKMAAGLISAVSFSVSIPRFPSIFFRPPKAV